MRGARWRGALTLVALALALALSSGCGGAGQGDTLPHSPIQGVWHRAERGETPSALARRYGVPRADIEEINGLEGDGTLSPGQLVFVPGTSQSAAAKRPSSGGAGQGAEGSAASGGTTEAGDPGATARKPAGDQGTVDGAGQGAPRLIWPVEGGKLVSGFGPRGKRRHEGVDIAAPEGTAVLAAADGVVIYAGAGVRGYGNLILLRHRSGLVTVYAHNKRNLVQEGVTVRQGTVIAEVGATGRATGNHLHFEVRIGERPQDPLRYVRP